MSSASSSSSSSPAAAALELSIAFCAYGGAGVLSSDASPNDFYRAIAWVVIRSPAEVQGASLRTLEILGDAGVEATMKRIESVERLDATAPLTPPGVWQARGKPFDGTLAAGETRLRIEVWITRPPRSHPSTLRIEVGSERSRATSTCNLGIEWPTG